MFRILVWRLEILEYESCAADDPAAFSCAMRLFRALMRRLVSAPLEPAALFKTLILETKFLMLDRTLVTVA
jgi:hypothetical protein